MGKIMDEMIVDFRRKPNQVIVDFDNAWTREMQTAEKVAGELTEFTPEEPQIPNLGDFIELESDF